MFVVIYAKITDDKKNGVVLHGPTVGPTRDTLELAEQEARIIINANRNCTIIPRIYELSGLADIGAILNDARPYFNNMYDNMLEAKEAMARPVHRKRRRKKEEVDIDAEEDDKEEKPAEKPV